MSCRVSPRVALSLCIFSVSLGVFRGDRPSELSQQALSQVQGRQEEVADTSASAAVNRADDAVNVREKRYSSDEEGTHSASFATFLSDGLFGADADLAMNLELEADSEVERAVREDDYANVETEIAERAESLRHAGTPPSADDAMGMVGELVLRRKILTEMADRYGKAKPAEDSQDNELAKSIKESYKEKMNKSKGEQTKWDSMMDKVDDIKKLRLEQTEEMVSKLQTVVDNFRQGDEDQMLARTVLAIQAATLPTTPPPPPPDFSAVVVMAVSGNFADHGDAGANNSPNASNGTHQQNASGSGEHATKVGNSEGNLSEAGAASEKTRGSHADVQTSGQGEAEAHLEAGASNEEHSAHGGDHAPKQGEGEGKSAHEDDGKHEAKSAARMARPPAWCFLAVAGLAYDARRFLHPSSL